MPRCLGSLATQPPGDAVVCQKTWLKITTDTSTIVMLFSQPCANGYIKNHVAGCGMIVIRMSCSKTLTNNHPMRKSFFISTSGLAEHDPRMCCQRAGGKNRLNDVSWQRRTVSQDYNQSSLPTLQAMATTPLTT
ncbi:uncharacterized protein B0T23DRAFT_121136 [Neurospora hispaniola]|uniref:Uncharacterized protein n=1 Tax=Neurospora hispaniola TaxID=588809 RepID=A0AAJ0MT17_9PEZI|nr:hypothetical protein B0T23DRAFT_121136 [Neurospora hispaniola]